MDQSEMSFEVSHPQPIAGARRQPPHTLRGDAGQPAARSGADMTSRIVFDNEFPQAIRVRGLTLSEVAQRARLSVATVSSAVRGRPVNMTTAVRLAKVVSASPIIPELDEWARAPEGHPVGRRTRHAVNRSAAE
ncbi:MAG: helix-turn-helix transcriptional regulator [Candidatus Dormiibacterota bacterium]